MYDDVGTSLVYDELHIHSEFDAGQYGSWATTGVIVNSKQILGPVPTSETEEYLYINNFDQTYPTGKLIVTLKVDVLIKTDVVFFMAHDDAYTVNSIAYDALGMPSDCGFKLVPNFE